MPPRRSLRLQEPSSATIAWLSDDLLAKCFAHLSQKDLLSRAALVCQHWHDVSLMPQLLQDVLFDAASLVEDDDDIYTRMDPTKALPAAHSLLRWLRCHGKHVRSLNVTAGAEVDDLSDAQDAELLSVLDSCLALCSGGLEKLTLSLDNYTDFTVAGWAVAAYRLEELRISIGGMLHIWIPLSRGMPSLQRLEIDAGAWHLGSAVRLPISLTRLCIASHQEEELPSQVVSLTNLRSLSILDSAYSAASMASLARLTSLRHAAFCICEVPDSLAELTGLQVLEIMFPRDQAGSLAASLDSALQQLTQLTGLMLEEMPADAIAPASLAALSRLDWLFLWPGITPPDHAAEIVLPLGSWQRSLRHLATPFQVTQSNLRFLTGAEQLQRLSLLEPPAMQPGSAEQWQAFWRWAAQHEPLQHIGFRADLSGDLGMAVLQMQAQRPVLQIDSGIANGTIKVELLADWYD